MICFSKNHRNKPDCRHSPHQAWLHQAWLPTLSAASLTAPSWLPTLFAPSLTADTLRRLWRIWWDKLTTRLPRLPTKQVGNDQHFTIQWSFLRLCSKILTLKIPRARPYCFHNNGHPFVVGRSDSLATVCLIRLCLCIYNVKDSYIEYNVYCSSSKKGWLFGLLCLYYPYLIFTNIKFNH